MKRFLILAFVLMFPALASAQTGAPLTKGATGKKLVFWLQKLSDGTNHTGATITGITGSYTKESATSSTTFTCAASGTAHDCGELQDGLYWGEVDAGDLDTYGRLEACFKASGDREDCRTYTVIDSNDWCANIDGTCLATSTDIAAIKAVTDLFTFTGGLVKSDVVDWKGAVAAAMTGDAYAAVLANLPYKHLVKNTASQTFTMTFRTSAGAAVTGATTTCLLDKDGAGTFAASLSGTEVGHGMYRFSPSQANLNADWIALYCTATGGSGTAVPIPLPIALDR